MYIQSGISGGLNIECPLGPRRVSMDAVSPGVTPVRIFVDGAPKFYYASDIHLELRKTIPDVNEFLGLGPGEIDRGAVRSAILLLAGDIGCPFEISYEMFLRQCVNKFAHVIVVAGNHEYYSVGGQTHTIRRVNRELETVCGRVGAILLAAGDNYSAAMRVDIYSRSASDSECSESSERRGSSESLDYNELHSSSDDLRRRTPPWSTDNSHPDRSEGRERDHESPYSPLLHKGTMGLPDNCLRYNGVPEDVPDSAHADVAIGRSHKAHESVRAVTTDNAIPIIHSDTDRGPARDPPSVNINVASAAVSAIADRYETRLVARMVGCTLWSEPADGSSAYMNDYKRIYVSRAGSDRTRVDAKDIAKVGTDADVKNRPRSGSAIAQRIIASPTYCRGLTPGDVRKMHLRQSEFLRGEIAVANSEGVPIVVLTHHLPSYRMMMVELREGLRECYASNSDGLLEGVAAWICGHVHKAYRAVHNGTYCGINPYGYPTQKAADTGFHACSFGV